MVKRLGGGSEREKKFHGGFMLIRVSLKGNLHIQSKTTKGKHGEEFFIGRHNDRKLLLELTLNGRAE